MDERYKIRLLSIELFGGRRLMKKLILILMMMVMFVACNNSQDNDDDEQEIPETTFGTGVDHDGDGIPDEIIPCTTN